MVDLERMAEELPRQLTTGTTAEREQALRERERAVDRDLMQDRKDISKLVIKIEDQRVCLRWLTFGLVLLVLVAVSILEYVVLEHILCCSRMIPDYFIFLAIAPIASVTLIVIAVLFGVFRSPNDNDILSSIMSVLGKSAAGNGS